MWLLRLHNLFGGSFAIPQRWFRSHLVDYFNPSNTVCSSHYKGDENELREIDHLAKSLQSPEFFNTSPLTAVTNWKPWCIRCCISNLVNKWPDMLEWSCCEVIAKEIESDRGGGYLLARRVGCRCLHDRKTVDDAWQRKWVSQSRALVTPIDLGHVVWVRALKHSFA